MLKQYISNIHKERTQKITAVLVALLVAGIGTYLLIGSHAASPYASTTANSGTVGGSATSQSCTGASDGNCVVFGEGAGGCSSPGSDAVLGLNGANGYSDAVSDTINNAVQGDYPFGCGRGSYVYTPNNPPTTFEFPENGIVKDGLEILNSPDNTPVSDIPATTAECTAYSQANPSAPCTETYVQWSVQLMENNKNVHLWEVLNEAYLKGSGDGGPPQPQAYGALYLALYNAVQTAVASGSLPSSEVLLFNFDGDYLPAGASSYSQDAGGGGWLHDAVTANAGTSYATSLANAIEHQAFSIHPYGGVAASDYGQDENSPYAIMGGPAPGESNYYASSYCSSGCSAQQMATDWLGPTYGTGTIPPFYVTEYGTTATPIYANQVGYGCTTNNGTNANGALKGWSNCSSPNSNGDVGYNTPCKSILGGQAYLLTEAYNIFLADPHVKGIWWFEAVDNAADVPGPQGIIYGGPVTFDTSVYPNDPANVAGNPKPAFTALAAEQHFTPDNPPQPSCEGQ